MINVVGLGSRACELTAGAKSVIAAADCVVLRTAKTDSGRAIAKKARKDGQVWVILDELYDSADNFSALDEQIVEKIVALEKQYSCLAYLVDGDGFGDTSVIALDKTCGVRVSAGVAENSGRKPSLATLTISAYELLSAKPMIDTALSLYVTELDNQMLAGEVKLALMQAYGDEASVNFSVGGDTWETQLCEIDRQKKYNYSASVFIGGDGNFEKQRYCMGDLIRIMERLSAHDGCPWDKAQTHESIRKNMLEEAGEAVAAIDNLDTENLLEELGDVMLQSIFHADIARRSGEFEFSDVVTRLCRKLYSRHTHIFGADKALTEQEALEIWKNNKKKEK